MVRRLDDDKCVPPLDCLGLRKKPDVLLKVQDGLQKGTEFDFGSLERLKQELQEEKDDRKCLDRHIPLTCGQECIERGHNEGCRDSDAWCPELARCLARRLPPLFVESCTDQKCDNFHESTGCAGPSCELTCENIHQQPLLCTPGRASCVCIPGLLRRKDGACVSCNDCPKLKS